MTDLPGTARRLTIGALRAGGGLAEEVTSRTATTMSAASDHALRTAASVALTATVAPHFAVRDREREFDRLRLHAELGRGATATEVFADPDGPPGRVERRPRLRTDELGPARIDTVSFPSRFVPHHPDLRRRWPRMPHNATVWAQHWQHADGPRPTIIVCHGFLASPHGFNSAFFSLPWFHSHGHDVALLTLPFHSSRSEPRWGYSGAGMFASGLSGLNEAIFQAVHDARSLIAHLLSRGVERIGFTGISLGGYVTAAVATVEPDLAFVVPNCAVVDFAPMQSDWVPFGPALRAAHRGLDEEDLLDALRVHSPLGYPAAVPLDRRLIVHGRGDRLSRPDQAEALQRHWDGAPIQWFDGNHLLHIGQATYLRRMGRFLNDIGFGDP